MYVYSGEITPLLSGVLAPPPMEGWSGFTGATVCTRVSTFNWCTNQIIE